jgi:23S rRNA-/tRNA-specific pseudouridylate synthase
VLGTVSSAPGIIPGPILVDWLRKEIGPVWVVHRLDLQTSGVVLFAKSAADHRQASVWFQQRQMKKKYVFLAMGRPAFPLLKCKEPIRGIAALTQIEVKENFDQVFYGFAFPQTGRRHQIRIHLAHSGFPIAGDLQYGGKDRIGDLEVYRVALHAQQLGLPTGEVFEDALPKDFLTWLSYCRGQTSQDQSGPVRT